MSYGLKNPREPKDCAYCAKPLPLVRHYKQYVCAECASKRPTAKNGSHAHSMVQLAIRLGYIKPLSECVCTDCGATATDYDHRDYNKPLDVDPVCRSCNFRRGPAIVFKPTT
jgi:DNA-directed RNA polymerase subunit RPC12/RpoP